jgi:hypothetical protein
MTVATDAESNRFAAICRNIGTTLLDQQAPSLAEVWLREKYMKRTGPRLRRACSFHCTQAFGLLN